MADKTIKVISLTTTQQLMISELVEVAASVPGEPDCKLTEHYVLGDSDTLTPWLVEATTQNEFMISSDKILTLVDPKPTLVEKYENLLK